jgi:ketosteroid isomerase-like protein
MKALKKTNIVNAALSRIIIIIPLVLLSIGLFAQKANIDIINDDFPEEKEALQNVINGLFKSIQEGDADKVISYHVYSPKFTEFRNDGPRFGSGENEAYERGFVGALSYFSYALGDLKIDVFGEVAIVTFEADFQPWIEGQHQQIWANVTLIFVKVNGTWKITHEQFSQFEKIQ